MKSALAVFAALMCCATPAIAADPVPDLDFFEVALCGKGVPLDPDVFGDALRNAFEKLGEPDNLQDVQVYHLPQPISRDGYTTQSVGVIAAPNLAIIGVLFDGKIEGELAKHYDLSPSSDLPNAYFRQIPWSQKFQGESGANALLALSDEIMPGANKTFLGCAYGVDNVK